MKKTASELFAPIATSAYELFFLTGKKYWAETAFCVYSLTKVSNVAYTPVFVDDGTFDPELIAKMNAQFPGCKIRTANMIDKVLETALPNAKFPAIHKKMRIYPHLKKLVCIHAGSTGWKMVLDSDMLFFKDPWELNQWISKPQTGFFLSDPENSYHYSAQLMEKLKNKPIPPNLNVGMAGLKSEYIDWDNVERWIISLERQEGSSYLLEQALTAMLAADLPLTIANKNEYIVMPNRSQCEQQHATLYHYVAGSKEWYYKKAWRTIR